jgi:transposase
LVAQREIYASAYERLQGQLEALLARHFPELEQHLDVREQRSALKLLRDFADPSLIAKDPKGVAAALARYSNGRLSPETIAGVICAAQNSQGVPLLPQERGLLQLLGSELVRLREQMDQLKPQMEALLKPMPASATVLPALGVCTFAVLVAYLGSLNNYASPGALLKACGLNLKVCVSGEQSRRKRPPGLHITKRGPAIVRKYLYLATLRWLQRDAVATAWYQRRSSYSEQSKQRAVVALMRKQVALLWHLSQGASYQPGRLFDLTRLQPKGALDGGCLKKSPLEVNAATV